MKITRVDSGWRIELNDAQSATLLAILQMALGSSDNPADVLTDDEVQFIDALQMLASGMMNMRQGAPNAKSN